MSDNVSGHELTQILDNRLVAKTQAPTNTGDGGVAIVAEAPDALPQQEAMAKRQYVRDMHLLLKEIATKTPGLPIRAKTARAARNKMGVRASGTQPEPTATNYDIPKSATGIFAVTLRLDKAIKENKTQINLEDLKRYRKLRAQGLRFTHKPRYQPKPVQTIVIGNHDERNGVLAHLTGDDKPDLIKKTKTHETETQLYVERRANLRKKGRHYYPKLHAALLGVDNTPAPSAAADDYYDKKRRRAMDQHLTNG